MNEELGTHSLSVSILKWNLSDLQSLVHAKDGTLRIKAESDLSCVDDASKRLYFVDSK